jgi:GT2 family glycosyltransferase
VISKPELSIVIPTYNRAVSAAETVENIMIAGGSRSACEVIVVDDGSFPPVDLPCFPTTFVLRQSNLGLNAARNAGMARARAAVVAFLDDDVRVDSGWAQAVLDCFEDPQIGAMGGRIALDLEGDCPSWLDLDQLGAYLSRLELGTVRREMTGNELPFGANCAVRRQVFDQVGGFADALDRTGDSLLSGGDVEFFARVRRAGHAITYDPTAGVRHRIGKERLTIEYFERRAFGQGQTDVVLHAINTGAPPLSQTRRRDLASAVTKMLLGVPGRRRIRQRLWYQYVRGRRDAATAWHSG